MDIEVNEETPEFETRKECGEQPLAQVLIELGVGNHEVVDASTEQITHKMVSRARKGRRLTRKIQRKILRAVNNLADTREAEFTLEELFNYRGK